MKWLKRSTLVTVWILTLVLAGFWGRAQAVRERPSRFPLFTGGDFGYRVDQMRIDPVSGSVQGSPKGTFVVRINGVWYEAK